MIERIPITKLDGCIRSERQMKDSYTVVYEDNGCDVFKGTREECVKYIEEVQVKGNGMDATEFGIYPI